MNPGSRILNPMQPLKIQDHSSSIYSKVQSVSMPKVPCLVLLAMVQERRRLETEALLGQCAGGEVYRVVLVQVILE